MVVRWTKMEKIPLRNIRLGFQTPFGIYEDVNEAEQYLTKNDLDINLISVVRIGDKDDRSHGKDVYNEKTKTWSTVGTYPIVVTVLADDNGFEKAI